MKLLLHIGTEKTGTTALQVWLQGNAEVLARQRIWVCRSLEAGNNFGAAVLAAGMEAGPDVLNLLSVQSETNLEAYTARVSAAFTEEVAVH